jgi:hypothetical protein
MKQLRWCATWLACKLQSLGAMVDPEILQWPGGTLIALVLLANAAVSLALGFGRVGARRLAEDLRTTMEIQN